MLEDHTMEKKPAGRTLQTPGKGVVTDSKKGQDGNNAKVFSKTSRRREPNAPPNTAKYEPNRKPVPQKSKAIDKRPRPRGQYGGCGKEDTKVVEGQDAEVGSVFLPGSKKQNLNHLLNFHYAPRAHAIQWRSAGGPRWNHGNRSNGIFALYNQRHKYNKEQYLQANCQFVVKANADYTPYANNPDTLVDWDLVEQIRVQGPEVPSCPICLYPPVAAKMTRCGHVYCWPCILHYLALSDKTWRKCPICFEAVHKQDLKSVIALPRVACNIEEDIEMRLMRREKGSLLVTPVEETGIAAHSVIGPLSVEDNTPASVYSKLLVATPHQVLSIVDREKAELKLQLSDETGCPEICFTEQAIELLSERESLIKESLIKEGMEVNKNEPIVNEKNSDCSETNFIGNIHSKSETLIYESAFDNIIINASETPVVESSEESPNDLDNAFGKSEDKIPEEDNSLRCRNESMSSEGLGSEEGNSWECSITAEDLELAPSNQSFSNSVCFPTTDTANKYYYFYQAADGQHIYLHSLNVRMLERGFGSLENCPRLLRGRVLEKEAGSMTIELRKRLRCFQHLPLSCQFEVAEIALEPPLVSKETLAYFKDQLENRHRRRQRRYRDEQRWEKRAAQEEARKWGQFPSPHIHLESHHQFPHCGSASSLDTFQNDMFPDMSNSDGAKADSYSQSPPSSMADALDGLKIEVESILSKPRLLENESSQGTKDITEECTPPTCGSDSGVMSFAQMLREGKSKMAVKDGKSSKRDGSDGKAALLKAAASKAAANVKSRHSDESDGEGQDCHASAADFSFGDAIALALKKKENSTEVMVASQGKKKKKLKQRMVFNTNMAFLGK